MVALLESRNDYRSQVSVKQEKEICTRFGLYMEQGRYFINQIERRLAWEFRQSTAVIYHIVEEAKRPYRNGCERVVEGRWSYHNAPTIGVLD